MKEADTKTRILDAAERLFAGHGVDATSVRHIAAQAAVNLAAAHYHFGGKEELVAAVFSRRFQPMMQQRLSLLDRVESAAGKRPPAVEPVLDAFLRPMIENYSPLIGRIFTENPERAKMLFLGLAQENIRRFDKALARACPHLDFVERHWCLHFLAGSAVMSLHGAHILSAHSRGKCNPQDTAALIRRLIAHHAPGFKKKGAR